MTDVGNSSERPKGLSWARVKRSARGRLYDIFDQPRRIRDRIKDALQRRREEKHFAPIVARERTELEAARAEYGHLYKKSDEKPLISILVNTWNRAELLTQRAIPSALEQTYPNIELIVVGDYCTDDTDERVRTIKDPRLRWCNLSKSDKYPKGRKNRWRVGGAIAIRRAIEMARGLWIAKLDDDESFTPNHVEALWEKAVETDAEIVFGGRHAEYAPGQWRYWAGDLSAPIRPSSRACTLCRTYIFRIFLPDIECWRIGWPGDQHIWRRMRETGVRDILLDRVVTIAPLRPGITLGGWRAEDRKTEAST